MICFHKEINSRATLLFLYPFVTLLNPYDLFPQGDKQPGNFIIFVSICYFAKSLVI